MITPSTIGAVPIDPGFTPYVYATVAPAPVGVAVTVNRVPVAISALVTVPVPVEAAAVTSPDHAVICPSATTESDYIVNNTYM